MHVQTFLALIPLLSEAYWTHQTGLPLLGSAAVCPTCQGPFLVYGDNFRSKGQWIRTHGGWLHLCRQELKEQQLVQGDSGSISKQPQHWWGNRHAHYEIELGCYMNITSGSLFSCIKMSRKLNWSLGGSAEMANRLSTVIWVTVRTGCTSPFPSNNGNLVTKCSQPWTHCLSVEYHHVDNENICLIPHCLSPQDWLPPFPDSLILFFYSRNTSWAPFLGAKRWGYKGEEHRGVFTTTYFITLEFCYRTKSL